ncbi:hypothetical protein B9Z55_004913 [Caenorhabditis nigoni]|uniref:Uncharacterized protein n=1 Tax=Caenorhabditis nigoni TaxID=1611254 RepID=A0A2G5UYL3_9PELO|nr:hypothetical protein B9Z55_004913 [Caenorhabditis nigoni]
MLFPTLYQLAAKSVAQQIHNDNYPLDFHLDRKSSNRVFRELLKLDPKNIEKLKTHKNQLSTLTQLDLRKCRIDKKGVLNLKNFKLNALEFGDLYHLKKEYPDPTNIHGIDIVSLLEKTLNENTQEKMVHLGFSGKEEIEIFDWEEKVCELLPSLQSININYKIFGERCQFSNFCVSFLNLRVLDISSAKGLSTLEGIKNLKHLQKLVMRNVRIEDRDGYKELPELKNLRFLDVSGEQGSLLAAEVRMQNLEFLDCSMTYVEERELREFVDHHSKLKTVVAISTQCNNSYIPTVDLLNFNSPDSTMKSLEYTITNDRNDLADRCVEHIYRKLNTNHRQLNDSEISGFLNALRYALRESKDERIEYKAIESFVRSSFFETKRFFNSFRLEIPGIVELIFKSWEHLRCSEFQTKTALSMILTVFKRMVNCLRMGKMLNHDKLLRFIMEKTVEISCQYTEHFRKGALLLIDVIRAMSVDKYKVMCNNKKVIKGLFEIAHALFKKEPSLYQQVIELIASYLNEASEDTLKYLASNCEAVEKCYEQFMIIIFQSPTKNSLENLSNLVARLSTVINLNDPDEKTLAFLSCSIFSILLAKNLIENREYANTLLEEFNDNFDLSNFVHSLGKNTRN